MAVLAMAGCTPVQDLNNDDTTSETGGDDTSTPPVQEQPVCSMYGEDTDTDGDYDLIHLYDGCSLSAGKDLAVNGDDNYLPKDDSYIKFLLHGGTTGAEIDGGLTVDADETITVEAASGEEEVIIETSAGTTFDAAAIYVNGGILDVAGNSNLRFAGYGAGFGVAADGGDVTVSKTEFDNLEQPIVTENTTVTLSGIDVSLPRGAAVHISESNATKSTIVTIEDLAIREGVVGFDPEGADQATESSLVVAGAREAYVYDTHVLDQQTSGPVVDVRADYVSMLGVVVAGVETDGAGLTVESGCHYILETQQYSVIANSAVANSRVGTAGAMSFTTVETEGQNCSGDSEVIIHNTAAAFNEGSSGYMEQVVQLNGANGKVEFGDNVVVGNEGVVGSTISRSVDGDGSATDREVVSYNVVSGNGEGDEHFVDPDGTNLVGVDPGMSNPFYDNVTDTFNPWALYALNPVVYYAGGTGVNYQDRGSTETQGSITTQGGPNGEHFDAVMENICTDLLQIGCEEFMARPELWAEDTGF